MQKDLDDSESHGTQKEKYQSTGLQGFLSQLCPQHELEPLAFLLAFHMLTDLLDLCLLDSLHVQLSWGVCTIDRKHKHGQVITKVCSAQSGGMTNTSTLRKLPLVLPLVHCLHLIPPVHCR